MNPIRVRLRILVAVLSGTGLMILRFMTPRRHHIVVAGWSPDEPNASELVRALMSRYDGEIWWISPPSTAMQEAIGIRADARLHLVQRRWRFAILAAYVTAEVVFTTHGIYGMPATPRRKPVINVWHGEQAKGGGSMFPFRHLPGRPSTHLLVASKRLAGAKMTRSGVASNGMLWVANPRVDQLKRPASDDMLLRLGIDPSRPFVIWMPTFRQGRESRKNPAWVNTADIGLDGRLHEVFAQRVGRRLVKAGFQVVVKPHPLDLLSRDMDQAVVVLSDELDQLGVPLYSLIGRSSGLITDYSSVWVDCLSTDLPIAFLMPDRAAYEAGRGELPGGGYDYLPGPILQEVASVDLFIEDLRTQGALSSAQRMQAAEHLGLNLCDGAADRLLDLLAATTPMRLEVPSADA